VPDRLKVNPRRRLPPWLKKSLPAGGQAAAVRETLDRLDLHTVCREARCPNRAECFAAGTATFMILGDVCTRDCRFCAVASGQPGPPREDEPQAVAEAAATWALRHVVVTSVTRDDLPDGGAGHFAETIRQIRAICPGATVEVLIPDFAGSYDALAAVLDAGPDVLNHNVETVRRLYPEVRPQARYERTLELLRRAKAAFGGSSGRQVKSGFMVGLGETDEEVMNLLSALLRSGCDVVTIGQYLSPTREHRPVSRYVRPEQFDHWKRVGRQMGFAAVAAGPFVRSSYQAAQVLAQARRTKQTRPAAPHAPG